jgi:hypothetical protein
MPLLTDDDRTEFRTWANKARLPAPLPVNSRVRVRLGIAGVDDVPDGIQWCGWPRLNARAARSRSASPSPSPASTSELPRAQTGGNT